MIDTTLHRWIDANAGKLTSVIKAKIHVNFPADLRREPTTNYIETARDIRRWVESQWPDTLEREYDL
jgi:hypothetical protein